MPDPIRLTAIPEAAAKGVLPLVCQDESRMVAVSDAVTVVALDDGAGNVYQAFELRHRDDTSARTRHADGGAPATHLALVCESGATATIILTGLS